MWVAGSVRQAVYVIIKLLVSAESCGVDRAQAFQVPCIDTESDKSKDEIWQGEGEQEVFDSVHGSPLKADDKLFNRIGDDDTNVEKYATDDPWLHCLLSTQLTQCPVFNSASWNR